MTIPLFTVDAFTDHPFSGNPAAVYLLPSAADAGWMQLVAREMNLSETAFVSPRSDGGFDLRWFTPTVEVDLCGHATLASAHVLWEAGRLDVKSAARFSTKSGVLAATREGELIQLDFPSLAAVEARPPDGLAEALGARPVWTGRSRFDLLVELADEDAVRKLSPDISALAKIDARAITVTARSSGACDFVSRVFGPRVGIVEDPVTGSAHCVLAPHWAARLGRNEMTGYQASARGGVVRVRLNGDRVSLGGNAVTVMRAELLAIPS